MIKNYYFTQQNLRAWGDIRNDLHLQIALWSGLASSNKSEFQVSISEIKNTKTTAQLRGFHRLLDVMVPQLKEISGRFWDRDKAKELIKKRNRYTIGFRGVELVRSCKDATREDMLSLIKECETFAAEIGLKDCHLESKELEELELYYQNLPHNPLPNNNKSQG